MKRRIALLLAYAANSCATIPPTRVLWRADRARPSIELLLQAPHGLPVDRVGSAKRNVARLLQTFDGVDARVYRGAEGEWSLVRRWNNVANRKNWLVNDEAWSFVAANGRTEVFSGAGIESTLVLEGEHELKDGLALDDGRLIVFEELETSRWWALHVHADGRPESWSVRDGVQTAQRIRTFASNLLAAQIDATHWEVFTVSKEGEARPFEPLPHAERLSYWDGDLVIGKQASKWIALRHGRSGWRTSDLDGAQLDVAKAVSFKGPAVIALDIPDSKRPEFRVRTAPDDRWLRPEKALPDLPKHPGLVWSLSGGHVVAGTEHPIRIEDWSPGPVKRFWLRTSDGWRPLPAGLIDDESHPINATAFHYATLGNPLPLRGLGILPPKGDVALSGWRWFIEAEPDRYREVGEVVPGWPDDVVAVEAERGDMLIAETDTTTASLGRKRYFFRDATQRWHDVEAFVREYSQLDDGRVQHAFRRTRSLMVDFRHASGVTQRYLFRLDGRDRWLEVEPELRGPRSHARRAVEALPERLEKRTYARQSRVLRLTATESRHLERPRTEETRLLHLRKGRWETIEEEAFDSLQSGSSAARKRYLERDGTWALFPGELFPGAYRSSFLSFDGQLLVATEARDANGNGRFGEAVVAVRNRAGDWGPPSGVLPATFPEIASATSLGDGVIAVQELGDSDDSKRANEWAYYTLHPAKGWLRAREIFTEDVELESLRLDASGKIMRAQTRRGALRFALRTADEGFVDLAPRLRALSSTSGLDVRSFWADRGLAVLEETGGTGSEFGGVSETAWRVFERRQDNWVPSTIRTTGELRASASRCWIATHDPGAPWQVWTQGAGGSWAAAHRDVELRHVGDWLALRRADAPAWSVYTCRDGVLQEEGRSGFPGWFGIESALSGEELSVGGAEHIVDGVARTSVPAPKLWLHAERGAPPFEDSLYAPDVLEGFFASRDHRELNLVAVGLSEKGRLLLYRIDGDLVAAFFSSGELRLERHRLRAPGNGEILLIENRFADGTRRLHRASSPERWVWAFKEREEYRQRVYFDQHGYFYSEAERLEDLITFRNGEDLYSVSQLRSYLFRPGILESQLGLREGSLFFRSRRDQADEARARELAPDGVDIASLVPPRIQVTDFAARVTEPQVTLSLEIQGRGVTPESVTARIRGLGQAKEAISVGEDEAPQTIQLEKTVFLVPGENRIEVSVTDFDGLAHRRIVEVTYEPPKRKKPTAYVALVGASRYAQAGLQTLPLTQSDVSSMRASLFAQSGKVFDRVEVRSWCQFKDCDEGPTHDAIARGIPEFFGQAERGDYKIVYLSGHGLEADGTYFFVPADGVPDRQHTLIAWSEVEDWLRRTSIGRKVAIIDSCHAGAAFYTPHERRRIVQQAAEREGIYVLLATSPNQSAFELADLGNGLFTHFLESGLTGAADSSRDKVVSFDELSVYVAERVKRAAPLLGLRMDPLVPLLPEDLDFPLAEADPRPRVGLHIKRRAGGGGPSETEWMSKVRASFPEIRFVQVQDAELTMELTIRDNHVRRMEVTRSRNRVTRSVTDVIDERTFGPDAEWSHVVEVMQPVLTQSVAGLECKRGSRRNVGVPMSTCP